MLDRPPADSAGTPPCGCPSKAGKAAAAVPPALQISDVVAISDAAIERWRDAGADDDALAAVAANLQFTIVDLPGSTLGIATEDGRILIDVNAAGYGWFVDTTADDDSEFRWRGSQLVARNDSLAAHRVDLLTVLEHEIGHLLGLDHEEGGVMDETLGLGTRRLPTASDAAVADYLFSIWQEERQR